MTITEQDLTGGLAPEKDLVFPGRPDDPDMRESASVWLYEENGAFGFPRMGIEAEASSWEDRRLQAAFTFPGGRALNGAGRGAAPPAIDEDGKPTILGAGPLTFRCIEPFRRWTMTYDGSALDGDVNEQIYGGYGARGATPIRLHVDMTMVTPAWVQQTSLDDPNMSQVEKDNAAAMGIGYRFEHHCRATGVYEIDGRTYEFKGVGNRIHRQSVRKLEGFFGHCWLSAVFPNSDAFGSLAYPPRGASEAYSYNDAVIFKDGRLYPARILNAPFLKRGMPAGDEMVLELQSELGRTVIEGTTALNTFRVGNPDIGGLNLQQGGALFRWGDQTAYGMVERSTHESLTTIG